MTGASDVDSASWRADIMSEMKKKVSIIIPCYNAENVIDRTIECLVNQTIGIDDLLLIFVDDASSDATVDRIKVWEEKYPESVLIVTLEENGRQGRARNIGLGYADSEYIGFADDDDLIHPKMFEILYEQAQKSQAEVVVAKSKAGSLEELSELGLMSKEYSLDEINGNLLEYDSTNRDEFFKINTAIWNKLYRSDFIAENNLSFLEGMIYDDVFFTGLLKATAKRVLFIDEVLYYHVSGGISINGRTKEMTLGYIETHICLVDAIQSRNLFNDHWQYYLRRIMISYYSCLRAYIVQYQQFPMLEIWNAIKSAIISLFPNLEGILPILIEEEPEPDKTIFESLIEEIDENYLNRLVDTIAKYPL